METPINPEAQARSQEVPQYYYDVFSGDVLKGEKARDKHLEAGADQNNVKPLLGLLYDQTPINPDLRYERAATRSIGEKECLRYGRWLLRIVSPIEPEGRKSLNSDVLQRSWEMGLGPGPWTLRARFGSISEFYKQISAKDTHRIGLFDDWGIEEYISYFKKVGDEVGGRPTLKVLKERYDENARNPNPITMYKKYKHIGGLNKIAELAGYTVVDLWGDDEYIDWGVKFMQANDGLPPTARAINYLSKKKYGPSTFPIAKRFGGIVNFREKVADAYMDDGRRRALERERKLNDLQERIESGQIPRELFDDATSEDEMLVRYARFLVVDDLLGSKMRESKLSIGRGTAPSYESLGFVKSIRRVNGAITAGDIESTALSYGVFEELWPLNDYAVKLKVPVDVGRRIVTNQYREQLKRVTVQT